MGGCVRSGQEVASTVAGQTRWRETERGTIGHCIDVARSIRDIRRVSLGPERLPSPVCEGVAAESIALGCREPFESDYCGPHHLLIAHERLTRRRGCTMLEGLPASTRESLTRTLTFVPAGLKFREWHLCDVPSRTTYVYIDPRAAILADEPCFAGPSLSPRVHFESAGLWHSVIKLGRVLEAHEEACPHYRSALGVILLHELAQVNVPGDGAAVRTQGGLAAWQRHAVAQYLQAHVTESISVAALASLARLSRYHFGRAFKVSFGISPHRFHSQLRLERAKELLVGSRLPITEIALEVGFHETSSFSMAFRRATGHTPSSYRRSVVESPDTGNGGPPR